MSFPAPQNDNPSNPIHPYLDDRPSWPDRTSYNNANPAQAPPFDPTKPIKGWSSNLAGEVVLEFDGGVFSPLSLPGSAAGVNLPGAFDFPAFSEPPSQATNVGPYGVGFPVSPKLLIDPTIAATLAAELAVVYDVPVKVVDVTPASSFEWVQYNGETRRMLAFQVQGGPLLNPAEEFAEQAYAQYGWGAPHTWKLVSNNGNPPTMLPVCVPVAQSTEPPPGALTLPTPVRALLPNEVVDELPQIPGATKAWVVVRTDLDPLPVMKVALESAWQAYVAAGGKGTMELE